MSKDQPRTPDYLTAEQINLWSSAYRAATKRVIELAEEEVGHPLPRTRQITEAIEPKPEPEPDPPTDP